MKQMLLWIGLLIPLFAVVNSNVCSVTPMGPCLGTLCPNLTTCVADPYGGVGCCSDSDVVHQTCSQALVGPCFNLLCPSAYMCVDDGAGGSGCCSNTSVITPNKPPCVDAATDCATMIPYCTNAVYYDLMMDYCQATCGFCGNPTAAPTTHPTTPVCQDKVNPQTGVSDCASRASYCNNPAYYDIMTDQCPKTCGRCGVVATTANPSCQDKVDPATGKSSCPGAKSYCTNPTYIPLMKDQCPKTCGFC